MVAFIWAGSLIQVTTACYIDKWTDPDVSVKLIRKQFYLLQPDARIWCRAYLKLIILQGFFMKSRQVMWSVLHHLFNFPLYRDIVVIVLCRQLCVCGEPIVFQRQVSWYACHRIKRCITLVPNSIYQTIVMQLSWQLTRFFMWLLAVLGHFCFSNMSLY